jgi:DNA-binding HxlR family transcriptional regulator
MAPGRTYGDPCGIARALDVAGERWALLVVRELLLGPKRFTDLRAGLPNVSPDVLSQRLRDLEDSGVIERRTLPPPAASQVYELTDWGQELEPVVLALGRFGSRVPMPPGEMRMGVDSVVLGLKTLFQPGPGPVSARLGLTLDGQEFIAEVEGDRFDVRRGPAEGADAALSTDANTLAALLWQGLDLGKAEREGDARVEGDAGLVKEFLALFPAPLL